MYAQSYSLGGETAVPVPITVPDAIAVEAEVVPEAVETPTDLPAQ